jgi:hypothetical protein
MKITLEKLFKLADQHGADSGESDHTVGDLQDMLRDAMKLMTAAQKEKFYKSDSVKALLEISGEEA